MPKILHITTDNKFIFLSHALGNFERVYPGSSTVWALRGYAEPNFANNKFDKIFSLRQSISPRFISSLKKFDLIVLHTLTTSWIPLVVLSPRKVKIAWLGWGFDYYDYIYQDITSILLEDTKVLQRSLRESSKKTLGIKSIIKYPFKKLRDGPATSYALKKIGSFSPVLETEYQLLKEARLIPSLPPLKAWNYGCLEENLKNFIGQRITGSPVGRAHAFRARHSDAATGNVGQKSVARPTRLTLYKAQPL